MLKNRVKVSGWFRTEDWLKFFCRFRSYISTMKNKVLIYILQYNLFLNEKFYYLTFKKSTS
jgi:hypothetical protein